MDSKNKSGRMNGKGDGYWTSTAQHGTFRHFDQVKGSLGLRDTKVGRKYARALIRAGAVDSRRDACKPGWWEKRDERMRIARDNRDQLAKEAQADRAASRVLNLKSYRIESCGRGTGRSRVVELEA